MRDKIVIRLNRSTIRGIEENSFPALKEGRIGYFCLTTEDGRDVEVWGDLFPCPECGRE